MRLAILTPDPAEPSYATRWPARYEVCRQLFAEMGVVTTPLPWTDVAACAADAALPILAWGYHLDVARWLAVLASWPAGLPIANPVETLRWNTAKTYLTELSARGAPVVPTRFVAKVTPDELESAFSAFGTDEIVVKPQVSAGSHLTRRFRRGDAVVGLPADTMIQPFLPAITDEGELSLFFFGGHLAHAVRKVPVDGFRVQEQHGGQYTRFAPDAETRTVAEAVAAAVPVPLVYARIDLVRGADGRLMVMEVEAIEPDLYLGHAPDAGRTFAEAVISALQAA